MARSIWKGSIAFGLFTIPVELYSATRDHRPKFRLPHAKDEEPVRYERVCQREGKPVAWDELVKGYEYAKGHFVVLTKDDFKTAALEKTKTIDIIDFVDPKDVDERYFEMARQLIGNLAAPWQPEKYTDEYKENLMRVISAKVKGKRPTLVAGDHTPKQAEVVDLMARLRASLEGKPAAKKTAGSVRKPAASKGRKPARGPRRVA